MNQVRDPFFSALVSASRQETPFALAILSRVKGSTPQKAGAKAIFFQDGRMAGTLGGGCLEAEVQDRARRALLSGKPSSFEFVLDHDFGWDDGLICGGSVQGIILPHVNQEINLWEQLAERKEKLRWGVGQDYSIRHVASDTSDFLFVETSEPPPHVWIAGAGHIAQAVAPLAARVDFAVTIFDDRLALANRAHFPDAHDIVVEDWNCMLDRPLPDSVYGLILTRGHRHDALVLKHWISRPFQYLGMIGSKRKWRIIQEEFLMEGIASQEQLNHVHCPVGLDLGSESVAEIALSIVGQLIFHRRKGS